MTQGEFAARLDLSQPSVSAWERGESVPAADQLPRIAAVLNCLVEDLVVGVDRRYDMLRSKRADLIRHAEDQGSDFPQGRSATDATAPTPPRVLSEVHPEIVTALKDVSVLIGRAIAKAQGHSPARKGSKTGT